jgi:hypothetical protein
VIAISLDEFEATLEQEGDIFIGKDEIFILDTEGMAIATLLPANRKTPDLESEFESK